MSLPIDVHIHRESRTGFLRRLWRGDDFPAWAARFGKPIYDPDHWWERIQNDRAVRRKWPDWTLKLKPAQWYLKSAKELLENKDREAAGEQVLFAAAQLARAILLRARVFPLSRPELPKQLEEIGEQELANILATLEEAAPDRVEVESILPILSDIEQRLMTEFAHRSTGDAESRTCPVSGKVA
jgi:HEPN domain-containing protein